MKGRFKKVTCFLLVFFVLITADLVPTVHSRTVWAANTSCKIHFLTLSDNTDAILLECNGKFGMVDSGEDNDYPNGSNPHYPSRPGITKGNGFEQDVIAYLQTVGVTKDNFEFYIGTHPHSDHIGSADEIIYAFHPKRVYIEAYSDNDVTDSTRLWDNLYVYDRMVKAAQDTGATLIQSFSPNAPLYPETVTVSGSIIFNKDTDVPPESDDSTDTDDSDTAPPAATDETLPPAQDEATSSQDTTTAPQDTVTEPQDTDAEDQKIDKGSQDAGTASQDISPETENTDADPKDMETESQGMETASQAADTGTPEINSAAEDTDSALQGTNPPEQNSGTDSETTLPAHIAVTLSYVTADAETQLPDEVTVDAQAVPGKEGVWT